MGTSDLPPPATAYLSTGIPELDTVLCGGMLQSSVFIVQGSPGAGKTIFANQICFNHVRQGGRALYVTLLAESHGRLAAHLDKLAFFDRTQVGRSVHYISGFESLEQEGLKGILQLLGSEARSRQASLVVIDGLFVLEETCRSQKDFRKFINDLAQQAELMSYTVLLLTNSRREPSGSEYTMVDGWIELGRTRVDYRSIRHLEVHKYRGSDFIPGLHTVMISDEGMRVLPRLEDSLKFDPQARMPAGRLPTGVPDLDRMFGGGIPMGSTTLVLGPSGAGKTTVGLQFLAQSTPESPGLMLGLYETPERLLRKAASLGFDLQALLDAGALEIVWQAPAENDLDLIGYRLLDAVQRRGVRRLFVDGIEAFVQAAVFPGRLSRYLGAITNALRQHGCTAMFSAETPKLSGGEMDVSIHSISAAAENIMMLRYVEIESVLRRTLCLMKVRESDFDASIREFVIGANGLGIGATFQRFESLLTGQGHHERADSSET